ncbi:non-ribosomal peptide synthase protein (TIGR01720 family)/amino acid adenylation domain-containing protein [Chitinophaga skermanii]|uniref:Non-ribosomal peptide synthase protein (TIGR01720 family)/amino acid adenylation domain-containing protein n=1 Tax=Chitinophaga skermanii TaxID=331697 RepID=A0A327R360_9BACT|nr:non-ribosomal peptide synthetase [Chitinophaga skermanii]RAJ11150.1 non-ribosomal peptide synthase protein (TIGR01720 family)/amino acid adenylation domain-containing protein [Chitinophaga skermanii]
MATNATATVLSLYHQQVALHPHALAVITESGVCTYEELDRKSNKWAQYIVQLCLSKNAAVAVYMHRGESFVVAMLAIMKAGATYLPIDANTPKERVLNILQDAGVELVITDIKDFDANIPVLRVNSIPNVGKAFQSKKIDPQSNAYIIYTSGSTGSPKGTVVTHDSLYASTIARLNYYGNANCLLLMPSFAFDASLATIWWSLSSGASLIVASDETLKDAKKLNSLLLQNPVDAYVCVPSYYRFLLEVNIIPATSSHRAILGGEALDESLMGLHYANFPLSELYQEYGPTECTIWATVAKVEKDKPLSIGFPVGDVKTKIVEDELWLGGRQVAAKYLNRPIETAASFVDAENERWYRTGDIVSVSEDGELVFIGRKDEQVKVNGHRVELNEIVCCLQNVRGVKNAVVAVREAGGKQVIAFLQLEENEIFEEGSIRNYLQSKLPAYMVPGAFIEVSSFPQTSNGKVDKRALLEIYESHLQVSTEEGDSVLTSIILSYWRAQLARPDLGLHDSLLSFGANSLSILRFVHWLQLQHLHAISFADAFKAETVQNISLAAKDIYAAENENYVPEENLPISFTQEALWVVDQLEGSIHYHINFSYSTNHILHVPYFNEALRLLVAKYPSLATRFIMYDESVFLASSEVPILERIVDANAFFTKAIELTKGPLFRAGFETFEGTTKLYLSVHHMVADGWSLQFIISNLLNFYDQLRQEEKVMIEVDNSAISFALYQRESLKNGDWNPSLKYWSHQLKDCARLEIPADFAPATQPTRKGAAVKFVIGNERWEKLQNLCEQERVTPYMVLLTTLKILLYKYTNCAQDVCVGSVLSNRPNPNWQSSVGYFANTVAIRSQVLGTECVHQLLQQVKENTLSAILHGEVPFEKVVDTLQVERSLESHPFFDVMMVLQDQQLPQTIQTTTSIWKHEEVIRTTSKFRLLWDFHLDTDHIIGWLEFNEQYLPSTAQNMTDHFLQVLDAVIETPLASISSISILPKKEIEKLLSMPVVNWDRHTNLVKLFQEVALKFPSKTALRFEGESMDYYTLHLASNKLAHHLLKSGVQPKSLVPLCLPRSFEMVISILAVLKIGACYVPIDPEYPQDRIDFMLEDTASLFILTREDVVLQTNIQKIFVESIHYAYSDESELNVDIHPNDLAYIIYTSGSTGRPKGVMIEHQQVVRLLFNEQPLFDFNENDIWTLFHSYCFDFSVWEMYGAILYGGCLVIVPSAARNTFDFAKILQEENVTVLNQTPTAFYALQEEVCKTYPSLNVRYVIYGGEALNTAYLRNWYTHYPACKLVNMYGITETTVHVTFKEIGDDVIAAGISNIGIPIPTLGCLVMDADMQLLPTGVPGELYVKGDGLARGYYNNPHLTAERFIDNPFSPGEKLYRSGDLVRWTNAGEMEYLGRIDQQVKIRGYRIELGEIETTILQSGYVSQCVVIAYEGKLVAYVVSDNKDNILQYLQHRLPSYMVPSLLVNVPSIPITSNGKVDRKALPKPVDLLVTGSDEPRNETEQQLCTIWQDLLGISKVGIHDNFFEVGGDSIVSIQVVSRARKLGLDIKPRDIFQFQTIAQLSSSLTQLEDIVAPVLPLEGESPMLPIQQWFFEQGHENLHHYNQAVLLDISKEVTASQLQAAVDHLCKEHDALRFRYLLGEDGSWKQYYNGAGITVETISVETTNIATICTQVQQGLNIENGPIARVVLLELPGVKNGLFIAAHHLCTDGVSWRILCEDLESYITCIVDDKPLPVLNRTTSYRAWAERLIGLKDHPVLLKEASYWEKIVSRVQPLPVDHALQTPRLIGDMRRLQVSLPAHLTQSLLQNVHQAYSTRIDDILLSALQLTLQGYTGLNEHVVTLESHGREGFGADNSRVIGWFTSMYPVLLSSTGDLSNVIISTKESLRGIPYEGLGYGISKYFNKNIGLVYTPCILFNYLGRLSNLVVGRSYLTQSTDILQGTGEASAATNVYPAQLGVDGYIFEESLQFTWSYNTLEFAAGTIEKLANDYLFHLTNIIRHCINAEVITPTIWDTGLGGKLSSEEFELLRALESFEEVHPLTSVQAGMLYHGLMDNHAGTYVEQFTAEVNGVDEKLLSASWHVVLQQFGILRTSFHYEHLAHGVQVVHGHVSLPFSKYLIQEDEVESFLTGDRLAGFDFRQAPLMRVTLLEVSNGRTLMVWTFHHILLDGWSVPIVIKALQTHYESLLRGEPVSFEVDNFSTFTKYLQKRDVISEVTHWSQYLRGFETPSLLPFVPANVARNQGSANTGSIQLALNEGEHAALQSFAQRNRVTLNTLVQGTWSYLLSRYSGREDVLFGVTVSGRPTDIAHSEERVGLYIHTILQRTQVNSGNINSWLATIQDEHTRNRDYSYAPLSTLQELAGVKGDLFDSLLVFENFPVEDTSNVAGSLRFSHIQLAEHTNYLLTILVELNPTLQINFSYNAGLLNEETVSMVAGHFKNTLQQLMTLQRIEEIELLTPAENAQQQSFQGERAAYPVGSTMVDLLREAAILHANKPALTFSGKHMSYAELEERSNQLANYLQAQGVSRGSIVPLCLERSFEMVIGLLGIIKSGGAYVPIDPSYPAERIAYMCNGGTVGFVLTTSDTQLSTPLVKIEIDNCRYEAYSKDIFDPGITPRDPLYVIYTSGSTGQPKGVVNAHEGLVNRLSWAAHYHALQSSDVILQKTTYCFDVSAWELMLPLMVGARMVLAKPGGQKDSQYLRQLIEEEGVTVLHFVPGMLGAFLSDIEAGACESLQHVVCSGEALLASHVSMYQEKLGHAKLHNFYGPTEAAIDVTYWEVPLCQAVEKVLIGRPVQNVDVYILDKNLHRLPVGVPGELYIGGVQVALGYLNNPALTAERFITNPFGEGTLYKTGDLASWTASGEIEYHGRIDDQVKIRGYRIELGEIETTLQQSGLVQQNVVIANEGKLVAYVVSDNFDKDNILQYLQQRLPSYMVPSLMVNVLSIPITSNGKIDRKALPKPGNLLVTGSDEPRNETEQQLCTIWQDLLGISKVGIHDNFFEVGGDSIKLIQLYRQVNQTFGKRLNVSDLFQYNSIHLQAGAVQEEQSADTQIMV